MNTVAAEAAFSIDYEALAETISRRLLYEPPSYGLVKQLSHPWPEDEDTPPQPSEAKAIQPSSVGGVVGRSTNPIRQLAAEVALHDPEDQQRIPDGEVPDALLLGVRGRWRRPPALQRRDFEFVMKQSLEVTLQQLQAHTFPTFAALAKRYRKPGEWVSRSLRWCLVREHLTTSETFDTYFPISVQRKQQQQKAIRPHHLERTTRR